MSDYNLLCKLFETRNFLSEAVENSSKIHGKRIIIKKLPSEQTKGMIFSFDSEEQLIDIQITHSVH